MNNRFSAGRLIGILGGTFDPIHNGHLHVATSLLKQLPLDEVRLLPCYLPVHRTAPIASPEHRLAMTKLACDSIPKVSVDEHEMKRQGPSYMIDTLRDLKTEHFSDHLCLIIGQDAFQTFDEWHHWKKILDYCHLIIVSRPQSSNQTNEPLKTFVNYHETKEFSALASTPTGKIFFCEIPPLNISATQLRDQLAQHQYNDKAIPQRVFQYILQYHLYADSH